MSEARLTYQCVDAEYVRTDSNNKPWYRAVIVTNDTDPDPANIDPAEVRGFPDNAGLATGSIILYPDDNHKIVYTDLSMTPAPEPEEEDTMKTQLTYDSTAKTLTMDKTAQEIMTAINDGKTVVAVCNDPDFLAVYTNIKDIPITGVMSAHVTTVYALEGEGAIVDAIANNSADLTAAPLQLSFYQETGEGKYPVYQVA